MPDEIEEPDILTIKIPAWMLYYIHGALGEKILKSPTENEYRIIRKFIRDVSNGMIASDDIV